MVGSSTTSYKSYKPFMFFTGTDPGYSVETYLNAGPDSINKPPHQSWIHRRTALIQNTLDGAAQKWFSVLPVEIKSDCKQFFYKIFQSKFDSEKKQTTTKKSMQ